MKLINYKKKIYIFNNLKKLKKNKIQIKIKRKFLIKEKDKFKF